MAENFGRKKFWGLLKICHLAEFTLADEPGLAIILFITKWLLKMATQTGFQSGRELVSAQLGRN